MKLSDNLVSPKTNSKTLCVASSKKAPTNVGEKEYRGVKVNIKETTFLTTKLQLRSEKKNSSAYHQRTQLLFYLCSSSLFLFLEFKFLLFFDIVPYFIILIVAFEWIDSLFIFFDNSLQNPIKSLDIAL